MSGVTRPCEAVQTNARSRASASATGRRARPAAAHATASAANAMAIELWAKKRAQLESGEIDDSEYEDWKASL